MTLPAAIPATAASTTGRRGYRPRRGQTLALACGMLLAVLVLAVGITVWDLRRVVVAEAMKNTDNLAIVLAEQTSRSVQAVDIVLRDVQEHIASLHVTTPEEFRSILSSWDTHAFLRGRLDRLPQVDNLALVGADGVRVNYSVGWPAPAMDMSDRDYARHFAARSDTGLFISEPVISRATDGWSLYLVRPAIGPNGAYLGMILASVPLKGFHDLFRSINLPLSESLMLLRRDGTVLVRYPDPAERAGAKMPARLALVREGRGRRRAI